MLQQTNGPQDFSLGMIKAYDVLYESFYFHFAITKTRVIEKKTKDTLARNPPC